MRTQRSPLSRIVVLDVRCRVGVERGAENHGEQADLFGRELQSRPAGGVREAQTAPFAGGQPSPEVLEKARHVRSLKTQDQLVVRGRQAQALSGV